MQILIALPITDKKILGLKQKFQPQASFEPHITLVPPGKLLVSVSQALKAFNTIKVAGFELSAKGIRKFNRGSVIALAFDSPPVLASYQKALAERFEGHIVESEGRKVEFVPHLTIARPRKPQHKRKILEDLTKEHLDFQVTIDRAVLFRREKESDPWQLLETVRFL